MMQQATERSSSAKPQTANGEAPAFKPVALPALAAAMHAVRPQPRLPKNRELPAILRKESMVD